MFKSSTNCCNNISIGLAEIEVTDYFTEKQRLWWEIDLFITFLQSAAVYDKGCWKGTEIICLDPNFRRYWELWDREASVWGGSGGEELSFVMFPAWINMQDKEW